MILTAVLVAVLAISASDTVAREKKQRLRQDTTPLVTTRDYDGTPIIMQGFRRTRPVQEPAGRREHIEIPRSSGTYIPPPVPSPSGGPPAAVLVQPPPAPYKPPPINSFSDRVTNCIHSYPLNAGVGNNPTNQQMYVRQCAN